MSVTVIDRGEPIVSLAQAKSHLKVDAADGDADIQAFIDAAQSLIDGPSGTLGRAVAIQTLELSVPGDAMQGCDGIDLPLPPFVELVSCSYLDAAGVTHQIEPADLRTTIHAGSARLLPLYGASWPSARSDVDAVRIRYRAGYEDEKDVRPLRTAMLMLIAHWYANREAVNVGNIVSTFPLAVDMLLARYRIVRV